MRVCVSDYMCVRVLARMCVRLRVHIRAYARYAAHDAAHVSVCECVRVGAHVFVGCV